MVKRFLFISICLPMSHMLLLRIIIYWVLEGLKPATQVFLPKPLCLWHLTNVNDVGIVSSMGIFGYLGLHGMDMIISAFIVLWEKKMWSLSFGASFQGVFCLTTKAMYRYNKEYITVKGSHREEKEKQPLPSRSRPRLACSYTTDHLFVSTFKKPVGSVTLSASLFFSSMA